MKQEVCAGQATKVRFYLSFMYPGRFHVIFLGILAKTASWTRCVSGRDAIFPSFEVDKLHSIALRLIVVLVMQGFPRRSYYILNMTPLWCS